MIRRGLVSCQWLAENISQRSVKVIDASWYLPSMNKFVPHSLFLPRFPAAFLTPRAARRNNKLDFQQRRIKGAQFFDVDDIKDHSTSLPHMLPTKEEFARRVAELGINLYEDFVVAYDGSGIFSAPRAFWMFQVPSSPSFSVRTRRNLCRILIDLLSSRAALSTQGLCRSERGLSSLPEALPRAR